MPRFEAQLATTADIEARARSAPLSRAGAGRRERARTGKEGSILNGVRVPPRPQVAHFSTGKGGVTFRPAKGGDFSTGLDSRRPPWLRDPCGRRAAGMRGTSSWCLPRVEEHREPTISRTSHRLCTSSLVPNGEVSVPRRAPSAGTRERVLGARRCAKRLGRTTTPARYEPFTLALPAFVPFVPSSHYRERSRTGDVFRGLEPNGAEGTSPGCR